MNFNLDVQIKCFFNINYKKNNYKIKLSIYVHPDKNKDNQDRAQIAFEGIFKIRHIILKIKFSFVSKLSCQ